MSGRRAPITKDDVEIFLSRYLRDMRQARELMLTPELARTEWKRAMGKRLWDKLRAHLQVLLAAWNAAEEELLDAQP